MSLTSGREHDVEQDRERERDSHEADVGIRGAARRAPRDEGASASSDGASGTLHEIARTAAHRIDQTALQVQHERLPRRRALARGITVAAVYALGVVAMILLALAAHAANALQPFDLPFTRELQEHPTPLVSAILTFVSALGYSPVVEGIVIAVALTLVLLRLRLEAIFLLATSLADALGGLIKLVVNRQRPSPSLVHVAQHLSSPSFPSGHTLHYTVFYGFLAFVLLTSFRPSWLRNSLIALCFALIVLVGISRVYLGEHWATDVLGGYLLGGLFLLPLSIAYLWARAHFNSATLRPLPHPATPG